MRAVWPRLCRQLIRAALVGFGVGATEALLVTITDHDLFLSWLELLRLGVVAMLCACSVTVVGSLAWNMLVSVVAGDGAHDGRAPRRLVGIAALFVWPFATWSLSLLSAGRRVKDLPGRPLIVIVLAAACALAFGMIARQSAALAADGGKRASRAVPLFGVGIVVCLVVDALVLRRLYPAFHVSLAVSASLLAILAAPLVSLPRRLRASVRPFGATVLALAVLAPFQVAELASAPNLRFAVRVAAPLTGKWLAYFERGSSGELPAVAGASAVLGTTSLLPPSAKAGVNLRGRDVLLITIDALRADRLTAYGHVAVAGATPLTPALDALARESVVFTRAYSPTPHTSYAVGSLLTGKPLRLALALPNAPHEHATLPGMLRRYGYRTAGFYPPAIFFVDSERFKALHEDHFGFEYQKEMFAPASKRVEQLSAYLDASAAGHPVFAWVHLFEPHEPYEPPAAFRRGELPEQLYDGEVAAADDAVGKLVRAFRDRKPDGVVIVTADHGEEFGDHGGYHHGTTLFEEQVRVPLLWSAPRALAPRTVAGPVSLIDLTTTLLAALGVPRDARMRGADLSAVLLGAAPPAPLRAFASIDELRMWTDDRYKLICEHSCMLFDLAHDPAEQHDVSQTAPEALARLRGELGDFVASVPQVEIAAMESGAGWPSALARARLGDPAAGPELLPLLGSRRPEVRAEALRAVARLQLVEARQVVATLREDSDPVVRDEAALTALALGDASAAEAVTGVLEHSDNKELQHRAAFLLPPNPKVVSVLLELAADTHAEEWQRKAALDVLASIKAADTAEPLIDALDDVRMRPFVARTLGAIGGSRAADALLHALTSERYPEARAAEVRALLDLHDRRVKPEILRFLGMQSGLPSGALSLLSFGESTGRHGFAVDLRKPTEPGAPPFARILSGEWSCEPERGCRPGKDAQLSLAAGKTPSGDAQLVIDLYDVAAGRALMLNGARIAIPSGSHSLSVPLAKTNSARIIAIQASEPLFISALAIVPRSEEIPPPTPQPYDAGLDASE